MKELCKTAYKVILLLMDILVFTYQIVRKVILPSNRRKGNVLSSLLSFFVGFLERILSFEKSILRQPFVCKHRYVKQALILATTFLFLLSSIEWTVGQASVATVNKTQAVITNKPVDEADKVLAKRHVDSYGLLAGRDFFAPGYPSYKLSHSLSDEIVTYKRWSRYCNFRI